MRSKETNIGAVLYSSSTFTSFIIDVSEKRGDLKIQLSFRMYQQILEHQVFVLFKMRVDEIATICNFFKPLLKQVVHSFQLSLYYNISLSLNVIYLIVVDFRSNIDRDLHKPLQVQCTQRIRVVFKVTTQTNLTIQNIDLVYLMKPVKIDRTHIYAAKKRLFIYSNKLFNANMTCIWIPIRV